MIKVTICLGTTCHIKGSRRVIECFQRIIEEKELDNEVELGGEFCTMKRCSEGVCVKVNDEYYSVTPENAEDFFEKNIIPLI